VTVVKPFKALTHRVLRRVGVSIQRWHDPYLDVRRLLRPKHVKTAVDGGAYHGSATKRLLELFLGISVHAFEPQEETRQLLEQTFAGSKQVKVYCQALSDTTGTSHLHVNAQPYTSSLLASNDPATITPRLVREISVTTLDDWAASKNVSSVDFIKLDLQGHELAALKGAKRLLEKGVRVVLAEVNFRSRYNGSCMFHDVSGYLSSLGFRLYRLYEIIPDPDGAWRQADALFVRNEAGDASAIIPQLAYSPISVCNETGKLAPV